MSSNASSARDARWLPTLVETLHARAAATPDQTVYNFVTDAEDKLDSLTYAQLDRRASAIAAELQGRVAMGDRVLLLFPPGLDFIAAFYGCLYAGCIAVPAYPPDAGGVTRSLPRLLGIVEDCQASAVLTTRSGMPARQVTTERSPLLAAAQWIPIDDVPVERAADWQPATITPESLAFLQYTSGSTAAPRGVRVTFANLRANLAAIFRCFDVSGETRAAIWLPPYHDMGLIGGILQPCWGGLTTTLMAPATFLRRPARWLALISRDRCTVAGGPNFAYDHCVRRVTAADKAGLDLSSWRVAFNGAEPVRADTLDRFAHAFAECGFERRAFYPCYGLAEATLLVSAPAAWSGPIIDVVDADAMQHGQRRPATNSPVRRLVGCGTTALGDLVIAEPSTRERLPDGRVGEIWIRGEHVADGYWNRDQQNEETFRARLQPSDDGPFLRTGDLGYLHEGQIFVTGRLKDLIVVAGRNHYPHDIELTAEQCHPALRPGSCVAFSVEDGDAETLVVVAEVRAAAATKADLVQEIAERVRSAVSEVHLVQVARVGLVERGAIPKTSSGKVQRSAFRGAVLGGSVRCRWADVPDEIADTMPVADDDLDLRNKLAEVLGVDASSLDPAKPLLSYGLTSLALLDLKAFVLERYAIDVPLPVLLGGATLSSLAQLLGASPVRLRPTRRVESSGVTLRRSPATRAANGGAPSFSLFFFGSDTGSQADASVYRLVLDCARFADDAGFEAIWTPERHFHRFGGHFPSPAVLGAAIAATTHSIGIRAGSVVVPLSSPLRIAEDWAIVDNLSHGRAGVSFATGWNPTDFVVRPEAFDSRYETFEQSIQTIRRLWNGEPVAFPNGEGQLIEVTALPRPYQQELPIWVTAVRNHATFELAGRLGANLLTNLLLYSVDELGANIEHYRRARADAGLDPDMGRVTLMLHTFVGNSDSETRAVVERPLREYIEASVDLWSGGVAELGQVEPAQRQLLIDAALNRHYASGLFGSIEHCRQTVARLHRVGVNEIACLVDFGLASEDVLQSLPRLDALRQVVSRSGAPTPLPPTTPVSHRLRTWPLTLAQERMWFLQQLEPESAVYNDLLTLQSEGLLDEERLVRALHDLVSRHEVLRTVFPATDGRPSQRVLPEPPTPVERVDLSHLLPEQRDDEVRALARERAQRPFDLSAAPPLRATLVRLSDREHVLVVVIHHIATDAVSARIIWRELTALYHGNGASLPAAPLQQRDIALRDHDRRESHAESVRWWTDRLSPAQPALELCADRSRPQLPGRRGIRWPMALDPSVTAALRRLAIDEAATPFMVLLSLYAVVLQRYSGQSHFAIGIPFEGRAEPDTADAVGSFVNTLALPVDLGGSPSFRALIRRVRAMALDAYAHADAPFGLVIEAIEPERTLRRNPIFQVMFSLQRALPTAVAHDGLRWQPLELDPGTAKFDLRLELTESGRSFSGYLEADADLFLEGTLRRIASHFQTAAASLADRPDTNVDEVDFISQDEHTAIEAALRGVSREYDLEQTIDELVFDQCARTPDAVALEWSTGQLTYGQLARLSEALASRLIGLGARRGEVVALVAHRSPELVVGLLAILRTGAAFLPLNPSQPADRIAFMVADAAPRFILAQPDASENLRHGSCPVVPLVLEPDSGTVTRYTTPARSSNDIAYVMYTSGSTGRPKGVRVGHRGAVNRLLWSQEDLPLAATDAVLQKTAITFDVFVWEALSPLLAGARLVLAERGIESDPAALVEDIRRHGVTVLHFVPSMLRTFLEHRQLDGLHVRRVHCSGEVLPVEVQNRCFDRLPGVELINLYGPTEASVDVTWWRCRHEPESRSVPIGAPAANVGLHLLDERSRPVPAGLPGELCVSGVQLADGYMNRPDADTVAFVDVSGVGRVYRTGDVARLRPDAVLEYIGRGDDQVKIRGYRVEPGEVEAVLREHPGIRDAVVVMRELATGDQGLVAYVVFRDSAHSLHGLREFLATRLPEQMIPAAFAPLDELPRTSSGKVDRGRLPAPPAPSRAEGGEDASPFEKEVAALFCEVLGLRHVGIQHSFFDLGGHSLLAAKLMARIHAVFGVDVGLRSLFMEPTPRGVSRVIAQMFAGEVSVDHLRLALDREALAREGRLDPAFEVRRRFVGGEPPKDILLTGATGFVGAFLLEELIATTDARIHCLVRASSAEQGLERIRRNLMHNGVWDESSMRRRIRAVPGNLSHESLGLDPETYEQLAAGVDVVFHNAALVDHARLYRALRAPNVSGTLELLKLANVGRARAFHYISTLSVFEAPAYEGIAQVDESDEPIDPLCHDSYAQSKWVAERLVRQAGQRGLPVTVHRLAMCTGDSRTGRGGGTGLFAGFLSGVIGLGASPDLRLDTWLTPIDFVARGICHLAMGHEGSEPGVFHLACEAPVPYEWILETLGLAGYPVDSLPFESWRSTAIERTTPDSPLYPLLGFVTDDLQHLYGRGRRPLLNSAATSSRLARAGIICPAMSQELLRGYVEYWKDIGLLERAATSRPIR